MKRTTSAEDIAASDGTDRRTFLTRMASTGIGVGLLGIGLSSRADGAPGPMKSGLTEQDFRMGVIGPAELSLVTSQIAVQRATKADAREFARFELREAIAVTTVLKELRTRVPAMTAKARATLAEIRAAAPGADFDRAYIMAQHENHVFLRDLATAYLKNTTPRELTFAEQQGRHLATLSLNQFTEHVEITARILRELHA